MATDPLISVIVASHARPNTIYLVLKSLQEQKNVNIEVVVVDNKSDKSDELAALVAGFDGVRFIRLSENLGFGRSINQGIAVTTAPFLYFACDDVILEPTCLRRLLDAMQCNQSVGLVAGVMFDYKSPQIIRFAGASHTFQYKSCLSIWVAVPATANDMPYYTDFVPGGMLMVRRELLEHVGGYREDFFMYSEDVELSLRIRRAGFKLCVVPTAAVFDLGPPHTYDIGVVNASKLRNYLAVVILYAPWHWMLFIIGRTFIGNTYRLLVWSNSRKMELLKGWMSFLWSLPSLLSERFWFTVKKLYFLSR